MSTCSFNVGDIVTINNTILSRDSRSTLVGLTSTVTRVIQPATGAPWWRIELEHCDPKCFLVSELDLVAKKSVQWSIRRAPML